MLDVHGTVTFNTSTEFRFPFTVALAQLQIVCRSRLSYDWLKLERIVRMKNRGLYTISHSSFQKTFLKVHRLALH